jgi:hypothetical protein
LKSESSSIVAKSLLWYKHLRGHLRAHFRHFFLRLECFLGSGVLLGWQDGLSPRKVLRIRLIPLLEMHVHAL